MRDGVADLQNTSALFIVTSSPIRAESAILPQYSSFTFSPKNSTRSADLHLLLRQPPSTILEEELQNAHCHLLKKYSKLKEQAIVMQSSMVLNTSYCNRLRTQLEAQEESRKRTAKGKLMGDGLPRLLTSRNFVQRVEEFSKAAEERESTATKKCATKQDCTVLKAEWERLKKDHIEQNKVIHIQWKEDCRIWDANQKMRVPQGPRPRWKDVWFPPVPKPWKTAATEKGKGKDDGEGDEDEIDKDIDKSDSDDDTDENE